MMNFSIFCSSFSGSSHGQTKTKTDADVRPSLLIYTEKVALAVCVDVQTTQLRKKKEKERELDAIDAFPTEMGTSHSLRITNQPPHFDTVVNANLLTNSLSHSHSLICTLSLSGVFPTLTLTGLIPLSHTKLRSLLPLSILSHSHSPLHTKYEQALAPSLNSHSFRALFPSICSKASFWASCRYVCRAYDDDNDNDDDDEV